MQSIVEVDISLTQGLQTPIYATQDDTQSRFLLATILDDDGRYRPIDKDWEVVNKVVARRDGTGGSGPCITSWTLSNPEHLHVKNTMTDRGLTIDSLKGQVLIEITSSDLKFEDEFLRVQLQIIRSNIGNAEVDVIQTPFFEVEVGLRLMERHFGISENYPDAVANVEWIKKAIGKTGDCFDHGFSTLFCALNSIYEFLKKDVTNKQIEIISLIGNFKLLFELFLKDNGDRMDFLEEKITNMENNILIAISNIECGCDGGGGNNVKKYEYFSRNRDWIVPNGVTAIVIIGVSGGRNATSGFGGNGGYGQGGTSSQTNGTPGDGGSGGYGGDGGGGGNAGGVKTSNTIEVFEGDIISVTIGLYETFVRVAINEEQVFENNIIGNAGLFGEGGKNGSIGSSGNFGTGRGGSGGYGGDGGKGGQGGEPKDFPWEAVIASGELPAVRLGGSGSTAGKNGGDGGNGGGHGGYGAKGGESSGHFGAGGGGSGGGGGGGGGTGGYSYSGASNPAGSGGYGGAGGSGGNGFSGAIIIEY
jgi:hypothetical protein